MSAREQFDDARMERLQIRISQLEGLISRCPFIQGSLIENEALTTSPKQIAHRLGRAPRGFIVLDAQPAADVGRSATQPTDTANFINIEASASVTATLWFY